MVDIPCIYNMSLIDENESLSKDILYGKSLEILLLFLSGNKTIKEISKELNVPSFSVQLYIKRLLENNFIKLIKTKTYGGVIEKTYGLASNEIDILNYLKDKSDSKADIDLSANHFGKLTVELIKKVAEYENKPHKVKAYFIKANENDMENFKKELDELFEKYQKLEDSDARDTYGFISILAPQKLNE